MSKLLARQFSLLVLLAPTPKYGSDLRRLYDKKISHWFWKKFGLSIASFYFEMDKLEGFGYVSHKEDPYEIVGNRAMRRLFEITDLGRQFLADV